MDNVNFTAIPRAKYSVKEGKHVVNSVTYQLEHSDLPVIDGLLKERGIIKPDVVLYEEPLDYDDLINHSEIVPSLDDEGNEVTFSILQK